MTATIFWSEVWTEVLSEAISLLKEASLSHRLLIVSLQSDTGVQKEEEITEDDRYAITLV